jgi:hypothetical protein
MELNSCFCPESKHDQNINKHDKFDVFCIGVKQCMLYYLCLLGIDELYINVTVRR